MSFSSLKIGEKYSKTELSEIFNNPNISIVREGIYELYYLDVADENEILDHGGMCEHESLEIAKKVAKDFNIEILSVEYE